MSLHCVINHSINVYSAFCEFTFTDIFRLDTRMNETPGRKIYVLSSEPQLTQTEFLSSPVFFYFFITFLFSRLLAVNSSRVLVLLLSAVRSTLDFHCVFPPHVLLMFMWLSGSVLPNSTQTTQRRKL